MPSFASNLITYIAIRLLLHISFKLIVVVVVAMDGISQYEKVCIAVNPQPVTVL